MGLDLYEQEGRRASGLQWIQESPHLLPVSAHIKFKALRLDDRNILDVSSGILWSVSKQCLVVSARKGKFLSYLQCTLGHSDKL